MTDTPIQAPAVPPADAGMLHSRSAQSDPWLDLKVIIVALERKIARLERTGKHPEITLEVRSLIAEIKAELEPRPQS